MLVNGYHLTYCTNIHPGESWTETFNNLKDYVLNVRSKVSKNTPFGIGLRLSDKASKTLLEKDSLAIFKKWLEVNDCYIFTMNGFPYGGFHHQSVKDRVHHPDWTTKARVDYSLRLFEILEHLLPDDMEGGISTSPLSYKYWKEPRDNNETVFQKATHNILKIAAELHRTHQRTNKVLHLDIEPEPDGLLENTEEVIQWYNQWLIPQGITYLKEYFNFSDIQAESCLKKHIRLCYDVCHFAIGYEDPHEVFSRLKTEGIRIGKVQISAALRANLSEENEERKEIENALNQFVESTYLHQVVERDSHGELTGYPDLPHALERLNNPAAKEWRIHFHVPVFLASYGCLRSTQEDIVSVLNYLKQERLTDHLEVETYTWEVLPDEIQLEIVDSVARELQWVQKRI